MKAAKLHILILTLVLLSACGGTEEVRSASSAGQEGAAASAAGIDTPTSRASETGSATETAVTSTPKLLTPPDWMPSDWDRNAYRGADANLQPRLIHDLRQELQLTAPFTLWAVAHDRLIDEKFEPVWVWWTALRSCERGIRMSEDLAGEFGDRERGKSALTEAREELRKFAATQPDEITMYFTANLGQWNESTGDFPLTSLGSAWNIDALEVDRATDPSFKDGAEVQLYTDRGGQYLTHMRASTSDIACVAQDQKSVYRFPRQSQWFVVFGEAGRGMGGLADYTTRAPLPAFGMTREQAAALAQRNPERKVMVAVKFGAGEPGFVVGSHQSAVRGVLRTIAITDATDGTVLASRTY